MIIDYDEVLIFYDFHEHKRLLNIRNIVCSSAHIFVLPFDLFHFKMKMDERSIYHILDVFHILDFSH